MNAIKSTLALPVLFWATALAADPTMECTTASGSQVETAECLAQTEKRVDSSLKSAMEFARQSAKSLDEVTGRPYSEPALVASQDAWEAYRTKHCEFVGTTYGGGSGTGIAIRSCRITLGRLRTDDLMRYVQ